MDGEHDTDTYSQKEVQPYILRESDELAETTVVADNANAKRECEGHNNYMSYTNQQAEYMHNAHNGRVQLIIIQAVYTKNGNISVKKHRSRRTNDGRVGTSMCNSFGIEP
jgi:hypothetical protein